MTIARAPEVETVDIYRFGVQLTKSYTTTERGQKLYILEGVASEETEDQQQEIMIQKGMNFKPLMDYGYINWDHLAGPENQIGEPIHAEITEDNKFFVRGNLYVEDVARAKWAYNLANATRKSKRRKLGWSVEGAVLKRSGVQLLQSEIRHLALTHQPVHANTYAMVCKSLNTNNTQSLALENLDTQITSVLWGPCAPDRNCYDADSGRFFGGSYGMLEHLCKCRGVKPLSAENLMIKLLKSGIY